MVRHLCIKDVSIIILDVYRRIRIARYLQKPVYRDHLFGDCAEKGRGGSATTEEKYTEIYGKSSANEFMARSGHVR